MSDKNGGEDREKGIHNAVERAEKVIVVPLSDGVKTHIKELIEVRKTPDHTKIVAALSVLENGH